VCVCVFVCVCEREWTRVFVCSLAKTPRIGAWERGSACVCMCVCVCERGSVDTSPYVLTFEDPWDWCVGERQCVCVYVCVCV